MIVSDGERISSALLLLAIAVGVVGWLVSEAIDKLADAIRSKRR